MREMKKEHNMASWVGNGAEEASTLAESEFWNWRWHAMNMSADGGITRKESRLRSSGGEDDAKSAT